MSGAAGWPYELTAPHVIGLKVGKDCGGGGGWYATGAAGAIGSSA